MIDLNREQSEYNLAAEARRMVRNGWTGGMRATRNTLAVFRDIPLWRLSSTHSQLNFVYHFHIIHALQFFSGPVCC